MIESCFFVFLAILLVVAIIVLAALALTGAVAYYGGIALLILLGAIAVYGAVTGIYMALRKVKLKNTAPITLPTIPITDNCFPVPELFVTDDM